MDENGGLANVHLDHSVLGLLKGILHSSLGPGIQSKKGSESVMWGICLQGPLQQHIKGMSCIYNQGICFAATAH